MTKYLAALLLCVGVSAQNLPIPDIVQQFNFVGGNGTINIDNRQAEATSWTLGYQMSAGLSGCTVSLLYATGIDTPGSFSAWPANQTNAQTGFGTAANGIATYSNLATSITGGVTFNTPWLQVNASGCSGGGNIRGVLYGYRTGSGFGGGGGGGGGGSGCTAPCLTGTDNDSNTTVADHSFPNQAAISASSVSAVRIVTGASSKKVYIGHLSIAVSAATTIQVVQGTTVSTPCDTGQGALTGVYQSVLGIALDFTRDDPLNSTTNADDICLLFGGSSTGGGLVKYSQR